MGLFVGDIVGNEDGGFVGADDGFLEGINVGAPVGLVEGCFVGFLVGEADGILDGDVVGDDVIGLKLGCEVVGVIGVGDLCLYIILCFNAIQMTRNDQK